MKPGDTVPNLPLQTHTGEQRSLHDFLGEKAVVLYFYPKDDTPLCTREACSFRDSYEDFVEAGAVVIGVSADSAASHASFARRYALPFTLVTDEDGALREAFEVPRFFGLLDGRVTYVIDRDGVVRHVFSDRFSAERHVTEALAALTPIG